ncbi:MAG: hypothetical protein IJV22_02975 [Bacteroidales bacterium]|nr:hypothetical protein [Bacteroidales bacterium]
MKHQRYEKAVNPPRHTLRHSKSFAPIRSRTKQQNLRIPPRRRRTAFAPYAVRHRTPQRTVQTTLPYSIYSTQRCEIKQVKNNQSPSRTTASFLPYSTWGCTPKGGHP